MIEVHKESVHGCQIKTDHKLSDCSQKVLYIHILSSLPAKA